MFYNALIRVISCSKMRQMDTIQAIRAFLETIDAGGFSGAARRLGVAPSVVMKRVNYLEHISRKKLLHRSTRAVNVTEDGQRQLPELRKAVANIEAVLSAMRHTDKVPSGHLRIGCPPAITSIHFANMIAQFSLKYPEIRIDVTLIDRPINPINGGFDIVIGGFTNSFADVVDIPLFQLKRMICGAPEYLARMGEPTHPNQLFSHRLLALTPAGTTWEFRGTRGPIRIELAPAMFSNDSQVLAVSAIHGNGLAMLPSYVCGPAIRVGKLVEVLVRYPISEMWFKAFVAEKQFNEEPMRTFLEWLQAELSPVPPWETGVGTQRERKHKTSGFR